MQAQKYAALKKPYLINDMVMQDVLLDRRKVYGKLKVCTAVVLHTLCLSEPTIARLSSSCVRRKQVTHEGSFLPPSIGIRMHASLS